MADVTPAAPSVTPSSRPPSSRPPSSRPPPNDFAVAGRNAIKLGLSLVVTWGIAFLVRFPLVRALDPTSYGAFAFSENFSGAFFAFLELGLDTYIIKEIALRPKHASDFYGGLLVARAAVAVLMMAAMAITLDGTHRSHEIQLTVFVFSLTQLTTITNNSLASLLQATTKVNRLAVANVTSKLLWGAGLTLALFLHAPLPLLALPMLVSELAKLFVLYPAAKGAVDLVLRIDWVNVRRVMIASIPYFLNTFAINIGGRLNVSVLEFVTPNPEEVGWFGATQNLASLAMFMSPLLFWVLMPLLARAKQRSEEEVFKILRRATEGILVTIIPFTLILSLGADFWITLAYGHKYDPAALSLRLMALDFILIYLGTTLSMLMIAIGHNWGVTTISLIAVPIRPLLVWPLAVPCVRWFGPGGAALGAAFAEVGAMIFIVLAHYWAIGWGAVDRRFVETVVKSTLVAAAVIVIDHFLKSIGPVRLVVDGVAYVALALAVGAVRIREVVNVVKALREQRRAGKPKPAPESAV